MSEIGSWVLKIIIILGLETVWEFIGFRARGGKNLIRW